MENIKYLIRYCKALDAIGRVDLSDNIENHLNEVALLQKIDNKKYSELISPYFKKSKPCTTCQQKFEDWTENPEIKNIHQNYLNSPEDTEETEFYSNINEDLDNNSESGRVELLKTLLQEWDYYKELFLEIINEGTMANEQHNNLKLVSSRLEELNDEINSVASKIQQ